MAQVQGYHHTHTSNHPLSPKGTLSTHRLVLYEKIGPGPHPCHWCSMLLKWLPGRGTVTGAICVDHLDHNRRNNDPKNLVPSCHGCNARRRGAKTMPMEALEARTTLRLPKSLRHDIQVLADEDHRSWNAEVLYLLEWAVDEIRRIPSASSS